MLNPINTDAVVLDGAVIGQFPVEIHEGVGWWVGACLVVTAKANRIAVAHDGHGTSATFYERLCRGAINAQHFACTVADLRVADEASLIRTMKELGSVPGALVTTTVGDDGAETVRISLYDREGQPLGEEAGLARIRRMIAEDHVPIPVNDRSKGRVEQYSRQVAEEGVEE
ncbi:hypothetical protein [Streptomyces lunaelactis]|uniref:hypothetical protein n=1 Tax=Streptomyces lunaelactis TaxID=1535768 RepID=UPI00131EF2DD|nr:hypothetical protein [Streptomyces lunaelactis]NUK85335.1 hypothetical protein [Streptomyces lunaelactis]